MWTWEGMVDVVVQHTKVMVGCLASNPGSCWCTPLQAGRMNDGSHTSAAATLMEDLEAVVSFWHSPGPTKAIAGIQELNQWMKDSTVSVTVSVILWSFFSLLFVFSLSPFCHCIFQVDENKHFKKGKDREQMMSKYVFVRGTLCHLTPCICSFPHWSSPLKKLAARHTLFCTVHFAWRQRSVASFCSFTLRLIFDFLEPAVCFFS